MKLAARTPERAFEIREWAQAEIPLPHLQIAAPPPGRLINAPVERVWGAIRNFHDLGWAPNVVTSVDVVGDKKGTAVGAGRVLNQSFHETLREFGEDDRTFSYSIDDGPSPVSKADVSNYIGFQEIVVVSKTPDGVAERRTIPVQFVPMVGAPP